MNLFTSLAWYFVLQPFVIAHEWTLAKLVFESLPQQLDNTAAAVATNNTPGARQTEATVQVVDTALEGDKGVHGFWKHGRKCVLTFELLTAQRALCLAGQEKEKRRWYKRAYHKHRLEFQPKVYSHTWQLQWFAPTHSCGEEAGELYVVHIVASLRTGAPWTHGRPGVAARGNHLVRLFKCSAYPLTTLA